MNMNEQHQPDHSLKEYRDWLVKADQKETLNFDKAIMTLSSGALGISITFLHDIVSNPKPYTNIWLLLSWSFLAGSLTTILLAYIFSTRSLRKAINQVDKGTIYTERPGGINSIIAVCFRYFSVGVFVLGVAFLVYFAFLNF